MKSPLRARVILALLCCSGLVVFTSPVHAIPEVEIRKVVKYAEDCEREHKWEEALGAYESLLRETDPGLNIRERYHHAQRRFWQAQRHQDVSYRKEVLSIEYGQAARLHRIITKTLLEASVDKKKLDSTKLFHKGLEELDAALANPNFVELHIPPDKRQHIPAFRAMLAKTWGPMKKLSRDEACKQIGEIAMEAEATLNLSATVVAMEFACGACYAIDEYTVYLTPNKLRELAQTLSKSEAIGVGLILAIRDNAVIVHSKVMGSPADGNDGIVIGDQLITVDKRAVADLPITAVKELLEGPLGSTVEIEVLTPGDPNVRLVRLERQRAKVSGVAYQHLQNTDGIWWLRINVFTDSTVQEVDDALRVMTQQQYGMKALVLDLRDNSGGIFDSAIDTARRFLDRGIITSTLNQDTKASLIYHAKNPNALRVPMAVLVNSDTASAAEVLAGALKDNNRAILVGQKTFGKGCIQAVLRLPDAMGGVPTGGMKLTTARFFSPKGLPYSGRGIVPHFITDDTMPASEMTMMRGGPTMAKAIEELERALMPK